MLEFDEDTHTYKLNKVKVPSVTKVLEILDDSLKYVDPIIVFNAARLGRAVHAACEGRYADASEETKPYVDGYRRALTELQWLPVETEFRIIHRELGYAGTFDRLFKTKQNELILVDIKRTANFPKTVGVQLKAYQEGYEAMTGKKIAKRYALKLDKNDFKVKQYKDKSDMNTFISALNIYKWRVNNGIK